jgi:quercetin dioxygenase-like cupin family protein
MDRKNKRFTLFQDIPYEDLGDGVKRKVLAYGDALMQVRVEFDEGAEGKIHSHPHTQLTYVLLGEFEFNIAGETHVVKEGDTLYKFPNVEHGCVCLKKGILLDTFSPMRDDFIK